MRRLRNQDLVWIAALILLFATGLAVRRAVLNAQRAVHGRDLAFTLESALQFRLVRLVYESGGLPAVDHGVQYPEGVVLRENDTIGAEYLYAALARLMPRRMDLAERVRWAEAAWFCLGIPLVALWLAWATRSRLGGFVAGAFYAVALSSVIRSTGQELSRENFALPLLIGHLAFDSLAGRHEAGGWGRWAAAAASAVLLALAAATWDLVQFYVILWAGATCVCVVRGSQECDRWWWRRRVLQWAVLTAACFINPYLRAHAWGLSPGMLLAHGAMLASLVCRRGALAGRGRWTVLLVALLPLAAGMAIGAAYRESYGHFISLVAAKIRFLGRKPEDPSLLSFDQRIMWVPSLHTATWSLAWTLFPAMLVLTWVGLVVVYRQRRIRPDPELAQLLFFYGASLVAFFFFVRFHVFLALASVAVIGRWVGLAAERSGWRLLVALAVLGLGLPIEAVQVLRNPVRWGRPGVSYAESAELAGWLQKNVSPEPVLANFGISAYIAAYGKCPVVLHPKFESREARARVERCGRELFKGSERGFRDWADEHGARYYVHSLGGFAREAVGQQMRYMVDAVDPPQDAPARFFELRPYETRYFNLVWENRKYRVFRMTTGADEKAAEAGAAEAQAALQSGDIARAGRLAEGALARDPRNRRAQDIAGHAASLKSRGFAYEPQGERR